MSQAKSTSQNLLYAGRLLAVYLLLCVLATCLAAPLRQQREVISDVTLVTKPPSDSTTPDCTQASDAHIKLHNTPEERELFAELVTTYQESGSLSFEDLKHVYSPSCKKGSHEAHKFKEIQCFVTDFLGPDKVTKYFCWCANSTTGHPIGNITEGLEPITECGPLQSCRVDNDTRIPSGDRIEMQGGCQICSCFNGTLDCHKSLSREGTVNFTLSDLRFLKVQLLKRVYIQRYLRKYSNADISSEMTRVTEERAIEAKSLTLLWKYRNMSNPFGYLLLRTLKKYAAREVSQYTCSRAFVNKFGLILDANEDDFVDMTEFVDFFNLDKNGEHLERIQSLLYQINESIGSGGVDPSG